MVADCDVLLLPWFVVACGLLVVAGGAKWRSPSAARSALSAVGLAVPEVAIRALGAVEIAIGGLSAFQPSALTGALVAVLYLAFTAFVIVSMRAREAVPCGCFGAGETRVGLAHGALNASACAVAIAAALSPPPGIGWLLGREPLTLMSLSVGMAAATLAAYLAFTAFPLAWRSYGSDQQ